MTHFLGLSAFPSPESDYAVLPLISVALMTNVPLYTSYFIYRLYKNKKKAKELKRNDSYTLSPTTEEKEKEDLLIAKF